mgnify:FL=1
MVISMVQNVYMVSMAFLVPLRKLKAKYVWQQLKHDNNDQDNNYVTTLDTPFVLYPNASCRCWRTEGSADIYPVTPNVFYFRSCYNGIDTIVREITVTPLLMELNLGKKGCHQYFLVLKVSVDKVFGKKKSQYSSLDFCTEFDIVNLKKAFFDRDRNGLSMNEYGFGTYLYDWLRIILLKLEGQKRRDIQLSYTVIDVSTQKVNVTATQNTIAAINEEFMTAYYRNYRQSPIDDYLRQNIVLLQRNSVVRETSVPEAHFVYGMLYANDNFMMADRNAVGRIVNMAYSNNKVEKYWTDDETIVHVKTGSPYYCTLEHHKQTLSGDLKRELPLLLDISVLIVIKLRLQRFNLRHRRLSAQDIEDSFGVIADFLYGKLFNLIELDQRMDYFVEQFHLHRMFNEIQRVVIPRKNSMEIAFLHSMNIWVLLVGVLTLLVTIISLFVTLLND